MIKKVTKLKTLRDKFEIPVDVLELSPGFKSERHPLEAEYVTGGFYQKHNYPMIAFYVSDKEGNILDTEPIIMEEGYQTYGSMFEYYGYTYI